MKRSGQNFKPNISFYFPELSCAQLFSLESIAKYQDKFVSSDLTHDWQQELCKEIGSSEKSFPWNQLRALQFDIDKDVQTVVCCDPVMMQMTHRGAYLWGQSQLEFSKEDVIRIIAQINQQLMGENECFYLLNNNQWLYTNKKAIELNQNSFEEYIGKDMFGFSYPGKDGVYWDKLATEIQMLIKQMMDYQGLTPVAAEMIVNVHFWGDSRNRRDSPFESLDNRNHVFTSDELLSLFMQTSGLNTGSIKDFKSNASKGGKVPLKEFIVIMSSAEITEFSQNIADITREYKDQIGSVRLITQDKELEFRQPKKLWKKVLGFLK